MTVANLADDQRIYGGTLADVAVVALGIGGELPYGGSGEVDWVARVLFIIGGIVDFPLSLAADTLTLPITVIRTMLWPQTGW